MRCRGFLAFAMVILSVFWSCLALAAEGADKNKAPKPSDKPKELLVSVKADGTPVKEVLESIAKQAKKKLLVESTAVSNIDLTLNKVSFDQALDSICSAARLQSREVYLAADSEYINQPDKLAAVVRLTTGIGLPDVVVTKSSTGKTGLHISDKDAVAKAGGDVIGQLKLVAVYVVTNDEGVSGKADEQSKVDQYMDLSKKQMEMLMSMSPDELEKALTASLSLSEQMDPSYLANIMHTLMKTDPEALRRMVAKQNQLIFNMSQEDRRAMIKLGIQLQSTVTPEQLQMIQDDTRAVLEEIRSEQGH